MKTPTLLILASGSPRRAEILERLRIPFKVAPTDIDETPKKHERAKDMVLRLSKDKAAAAAEKYPDRWVLAADSTVTLNGQPIGKPTSKDDAARILRCLSNKKHQVHTAFCLRKYKEIYSVVDTTHVHFRALKAQNIREYIATGEPTDKAGAYAIQGIGERFVKKIDGSYSNVMGLPIEKLVSLLMRLKLI